nr:MAG TPA: hypothetical protein [Herelleviridae sp.]
MRSADLRGIFLYSALRLSGASTSALKEEQ